MTFTEYRKEKPGRGGKVDGLVVSIRKDGFVTLSEDAFNEIAAPPAAKVLVDQRARRIRVEPADKTSDAFYFSGPTLRSLQLTKLIDKFRKVGVDPLIRVDAEAVDGGIEFTVPIRGRA